jgi:hypothetical protein
MLNELNAAQAGIKIVVVKCLRYHSKVLACPCQPKSIAVMMRVGVGVRLWLTAVADGNTVCPTPLDLDLRFPRQI